MDAAFINPNAANGTAGLPEQPRTLPPNHERMLEVGKKFESFFVYQMLELMAPEPDTDGILSGGFGEETLRHQLNEVLAEEVASNTSGNGFGIADAIYKQLAAQQDAQVAVADTSPQAAAQAYASNQPNTPATQPAVAGGGFGEIPLTPISTNTNTAQPITLTKGN